MLKYNINIGENKLKLAVKSENKKKMYAINNIENIQNRSIIRNKKVKNIRSFQHWIVNILLILTIYGQCLY